MLNITVKWETRGTFSLFQSSKISTDAHIYFMKLLL